MKKESVLPIKSDAKLELWSADDQAKLAEAIGLVFDGQKQFGKTSEQLENMVKLFCWVLKPYPLADVMNGLAQYVSQHSDLPTPSDIVKIIDPKPEPFAPDWGYYKRLQKAIEEGRFVGDEEKRYMRMCEEHSLAKARSA